MGRSEKTDRLPRYRAVLVATALIASREAPELLKPAAPAQDDGRWSGVTHDAEAWRTVAVAAGAVQRGKSLYRA